MSLINLKSDYKKILYFGRIKNDEIYLNPPYLDELSTNKYKINIDEIENISSILKEEDFGLYLIKADLDNIDNNNDSCITSFKILKEYDVEEFSFLNISSIFKKDIENLDYLLINSSEIVAQMFLYDDEELGGKEFLSELFTKLLISNLRWIINYEEKIDSCDVFGFSNDFERFFKNEKINIKLNTLLKCFKEIAYGEIVYSSMLCFIVKMFSIRNHDNYTLEIFIELISNVDYADLDFSDKDVARILSNNKDYFIEYFNNKISINKNFMYLLKLLYDRRHIYNIDFIYECIYDIIKRNNFENLNGIGLTEDYLTREDVSKIDLYKFALVCGKEDFNNPKIFYDTAESYTEKRFRYILFNYSNKSFWLFVNTITKEELLERKDILVKILIKKASYCKFIGLFSSDYYLENEENMKIIIDGFYKELNTRKVTLINNFIDGTTNLNGWRKRNMKLIDKFNIEDNILKYSKLRKIYTERSI